MDSRLPAISLDLIDFSDVAEEPTQSFDGDSLAQEFDYSSYSDSAFSSQTSSGTDSKPRDNEGSAGPGKKALELEDYVRKPRTYSRERSPSNEERPPPLPPKRRNQSRKNQKLTNRLFNAGIVFDDTRESEKRLTVKDQFGASLNPDFENSSPLEEKSNYEADFALLSLNDESQPGPRKSTKTSESSIRDIFLTGDAMKPVFAHHNRETLDFETKLKVAMTNKNTDLISMNLFEFEASSKPQERPTPPLPPRNLNPINRSSSCENLKSNAGKSSLSSLSMEDLDAFISDFDNASAKSRLTSSSSQLGEEFSSFMSNSKKRNENPKLERTNTLPPPRPEPPKFFNRLSLPVDLNSSKEEQTSQIYFGDGIFDLAEERNEEAKEFCSMIADLRKHYKCTNVETNTGIITDPILNWTVAHYPKELSIQVYYEDILNPIIITFNVFSKVQDVVLKALLVFQDNYKEIDTISKNKYIFKVCGKSCYLEGNERLINYAYVQNCLRLGDDICVIVMQRSMIPRDLSRDENDDDQESMGIYFKHFFDIKTGTSISRRGLSVLIETYNREVETLLKNVSNISNPTYVPEKLIQVVKALSLSLACIESTQIHEAINLLLSLKPSTTEKISPSPLQPGVVDFNRMIDKELFDRGRFNIALKKLTSSVFSLVDAYCRAFDTDFNIHNPNDQFDSPKQQFFTNERVSSDSIEDRFSLRIFSVHRIPANWKLKHDFFEVECGLYYGGKSICKNQMTKLSKAAIGFYEHIIWDELLIFDIDIKDIPRETKICISVNALTSPKRQTKDAKSRLGLAWLSVNLFDFKGLFLCRSHLFGLLSGNEMNPAATCSSSNIQEPKSIILRADFRMYHEEVIFPEALIQTAQSVDHNSCSSEISVKLDEIISKGIITEMSEVEKELIWKHRIDLRNIPQALQYVFASVPDLKRTTIAQIHELLQVWQPLSPVMALGLLTANFPDIVVRTYAVNWFSNVSESELCEYLPQLVQALKYETYHNSALSKFLITSALRSPRVAHYLFWHLKYYTGDAQFSQRFQIVLGGLLGSCGAALKDQLSRQDLMVRKLAEATQNVKETKDSQRRSVLSQDLDIVAADIDGCMRLPVDPSIQVKGIMSDSCSYYNSFTVPLSIVFDNSDVRGKPIKTMFKVGDDLRKDLVTLQLFRVMNRMWLSEGLDLKMITYECLPTAPLAGMIQLVSDAATLREIHVQHGVTGSFKEEVIGLWLQKYNSTEGAYKTAVDNFSASCAAYCVATYVLGIGDRHNDNIMVTQKGHLFHIDFSKFMGNAQKFGTIRRDRVPFVLTPDMAFVINFGESMSYNFQYFVELCCDAFNIIRKNSDLILNLLGLMVSSGIPYLSTSNDIEYVRNALQLNLSDAQATVFFTRLIEGSLSSKSTQWNFFIHNVAHLKDSQNFSSSARAIFSFSNKVYSKDSDGEILSARCVDIQKRYVPDKHYIFVLNILRSDNVGPKFVFRKYDEFQELHVKLSQVFGGSNVPALPGRVLVGRSEIRDIAVKRRKELDEFVVALMKSTDISNSEVLYTFLHSFIRDEQDSLRFAEILMQHELGQPRNRVGGELKISCQYCDGCLNLLVMHAKNLVPRTIQGTADPYVKSYVLPDPNKSTKRKTRIARKNLNPTYNQTLSYKMSVNELQQRVVQITVWDNDSMGVNDYLGGVNIYPLLLDMTQEVTQWYKLKELGLGM